MADDEPRRFRATAAWVMGETGDPRFTKALGRMVGESDLAVRSSAFAALGKIRSATAQARQAGGLRVIAAFSRERRPGRLELHLDVTCGDKPVKLLATQVILSEEGQELLAYSLEERQLPHTSAITFLFPRTGDPPGSPIHTGALRATAWKRPADPWAVLRYNPSASEQRASLAGEKFEIEAPAPALVEVPLRYHLERGAADAAIEREAPRSECGDFWSTIRSAVQSGTDATRPRRHLVICNRYESAQPAGFPEISSAAMGSRTSVDAISLTPNPALERLCRITHGSYQLLTSEAGFAEALEELCLSFQAPYLIRYESNVEMPNLRVIIHTPLGWGETAVPAPISP